MYRKSNRRWVTDNEMETMQKLWMNGLSVREIHNIFSEFSKDTIRRYVKDLKQLPRKMRKISFADLKRAPDALTAFPTISNKEEEIMQKQLADLQLLRNKILYKAQRDFSNYRL